MSIKWGQLFLATIWGIWLQRNARVFQSAPFSRIKIIRQAFSLVHDMNTPLDKFGFFGPDPINGRWCKPPPGYFKLNMDGSFRDGRATYAGVLRDHLGSRIWGFTGISHVQSCLAAELHALSTVLLR